MSLTTLKNVLATISPKISYQVYEELISNLGIVYNAESGLKAFIAKLNKITNNSGMQIVSIAICPDDRGDEYIEGLSAEVVANCAAIGPVEPSNA